MSTPRDTCISAEGGWGGLPTISRAIRYFRIKDIPGILHHPPWAAVGSFYPSTSGHVLLKPQRRLGTHTFPVMYRSRGQGGFSSGEAQQAGDVLGGEDRPKWGEQLLLTPEGLLNLEPGIYF